jgi:hypothetical protein
MTIDKRPSLRKCIDAHCNTCIYDPQAAGTWRQQVTLCSVTGCALYPVRPITKAPIPESTFDYYGVTGPERAQLALLWCPEWRFSDGDGADTSADAGDA